MSLLESGENYLETILVLDGTQGQNGLNQAKVFNEAVDVTNKAIIFFS